jgi:hypothetical protein
MWRPTHERSRPASGSRAHAVGASPARTRTRNRLHAAAAQSARQCSAARSPWVESPLGPRPPQQSYRQPLEGCCLLNPLIAGLFDEFLKREELDQLSDSDAFELFVANLVLGDDLFTQVEATDLLLDNSTIGVDVAVLEVNGQVVWDEGDTDHICEAAKRLDVALHLIQAKRSASVDSAQLLNSGDIAKKVLNNDVGLGDGRLKEIAAALRHIFAKYAAKLRGSPAVMMSFATTAPAASLTDATVMARAASIRQDVEALGFVGRVSVQVLGAESLHRAWVKKNHANEVEIQFEKQINLPKMPGIEQAILGIGLTT